MKDNAFVPCVGMVCKDLHIRGITGSEYIGVSGFIEYVGTNYFLVRIDGCKEILIIKSCNYPYIPEGKFVKPEGMKWEEKPCSQCGKNHFIQNRTKWLCPDCVFKNNHKGKTREQVYRERRSNTKPKAKKTGEREMFLEIWQERPHVCVKCGRPLGDIPHAAFFSHKKSKGAYPELRLVKNNVELVCFTCHQKYEFGDREDLG